MPRHRGVLVAVALAACMCFIAPQSARSGEPTARDIADLVEKLRSPDAHVRETSASALGAMGPAARDSVAALASVLKDDADAVRRAAAQSLGLIGAGAESALPALTAGVSDAKSKFQFEAIEAIGRIGVAAAKGDEVIIPDKPPASPRVVARKSDTETAVLWAQRWLKNHQSPDGHWDAAGFDAQCKLNRCEGAGESVYNIGVTGLALLAFLGSGETHQSGSYRETVKNALKYLKDVQDSDGCFGPRVSQRFMYNHGCAAVAMTEAYGMTGARTCKEPAQRGVAFVLKAKNPYLAWRYSVPANGENDTSVTSWMAMVLKSATMSELDVDKQALADAAAWVEKMTAVETGRTGYQKRGEAPPRADALLKKFPSDRSESLTAAGVFIRILAGHTMKDDALILKGAELMAAKPPKWDAADGSIDFYYWYYGSLAMFQVGGPPWAKWNAAMKTAILDHQRMEPDRDERGSWDPIDPWSPQGGRIYSTALNCLCMEVYYRYGRMMSQPADAKKPAADQRPAMSSALRDAVAALTAAVKSTDGDVSLAAESALDRIRAAYK